ncbi:MAG: PEP/pyruvate-binding domain-containing protein [Candidatus Obscuribacterales bacterium]
MKSVVAIDKKRNDLGAKAANLAILEQNGFPVPAWFAIVPDSIIPENSTLELSTRDRWRLRRALRSLPAGRLAVRSSSREEDGASYSFAGQFETRLNVEPGDLMQAARAVIASGSSGRAEAYRKLNKIDSAPKTPPAVIVQTMLEPRFAGVAFGACPISGDRDKIVIAAVPGLADALVSGQQSASEYSLGGGAVEVRGKDILARDQLAAIAELTKKAGALFGSPQDIEWAIAGDRLYILQARPITALARNTGIDIWDNSNIAESYPGVTTPLTFSLARTAYQNVYEQFALIMGVPKSKIENNSRIFSRMIGFPRGRIYYNLLNWYRLLAMFPGYRSNRLFMEQMMGVKESLERDLVEEDSEEKEQSIFLDRIRLVIACFGLLINLFTLESRTARFKIRLDRALEKTTVNQMNRMNIFELAAVYRKLESDLLRQWDAPIINDFFAMIAFGMLRALCRRFIDTDGIHNELLCDETGIISTEPARRIEAIAALAVRENLTGALATMDRAGLYALDESLATRAAILEYLAIFGDRTTGELKLETRTLSDNPAPLLKSIARSAARLESMTDAPEKRSSSRARRQAAEKLVASRLKRRPLTRLIFNLVLEAARKYIARRENLRFERTRVFGAVRRIFLAMGERLARAGRIDEAQDIFYLEIEEVLRFVEGTATITDLAGLSRLRRDQFALYNNEPPLPDRFVTERKDSFSFEPGQSMVRKEELPVDKDCLEGTGCCPGIVTGRVLVVEDPEEVTSDDFDILVARRTDPGWITLIAQARAVVVEYGSLLSHTAIVARELGIPTVVCVDSAMTSLRTGDLVRVDGREGTVQKLETMERAA